MIIGSQNYRGGENFHKIEEISFPQNSSHNLDKIKEEETFYTSLSEDIEKKDQGLNNKNINNSSKSTEDNEDMVKDIEPKKVSESSNNN